MSTPRRAAPEDSGDVPLQSVAPRHSARHPFTRALMATAASAVVPGLGLVTSDSKRTKAVGWSLVGLCLTGLAVLVFLIVNDLSDFASLAVRPRRLYWLSGMLAVLGVAWVTVIVGTHLVRRPAELTRTQRTVGALAVGGLSFIISAPLAVASRYALDQATLISNVFGGNKQSQTRPTLEGSVDDIWAQKPRLNLLLLGGDTTAERIETIKDRGILTDTIMVASIDTKTGDLALIQIPRNMARTPFPKGTALRKAFPNGWYDGVSGQNLEFMVNTIWNNIPRDYPGLMGPSDYAGADAMKLGVGEAIGLQLDYFVMLNIDGLQKLIDAMGGVTVNINEKLPIGGSSDNPERTSGWLQPGPNQTLNGYHAMWYARSRWSTDDFSRMARQGCLVSAIIDQADPATMLTRYEAIARASQDMVETDMPESVLPAMVDLALRVKGGNAKRLLFQSGKNGFVSANPDYDLMRKQVQELLTASTTPKPVTTTTASPTSTPSSTSKPSPTATPTGAAETISDACAYDPKPK